MGAYCLALSDKHNVLYIFDMNGLGLAPTLAVARNSQTICDVLEKRSNFAVKLIFQYEPLKLVTLVDFVHNSDCLN